MADQETVAPAQFQSPAHFQILRIAITTLSARAARWTTLLMSFGLFAWAVGKPDWTRAAAAAAFTILVHCPMWFKRDQ